MSVSRPPSRYLIALSSCALTAAVAAALRDWLDQANIAMLFLLTVFVVAVRLGRGPAVLAAFLGVALFDLFFVPPHLSFGVADAQYLVTFAVMLAVGLITTHLTAQLAERREAAQTREHEAQRLYVLARDLGAALQLEQVVAILDGFLASLELEPVVLIDTAAGSEPVFAAHGARALGPAEIELAAEAYRLNAARAREGAAGRMLFLPFMGATRVRGVLAVAPRPAGRLEAAVRPLLTAVASLAGIAIERLHYAEVAQRSELAAQTEKLRATLLSSISHDLRTPLTTLVGLADALAARRATLPSGAGETATIIRDQAHAMHRMVDNLLELARLQSGRVALNLQWQPIDEIVGSSVRQLGELFGARRLEIVLPDDLPLVRYDAVLLERVLCNLLENAAKYSAVGATIRIAAAVVAERLEVEVCNAGEGFPNERLERIFEPFVRGHQESALPGVGIGLALCRAVVAAHGGTIRAENRPGQACVRFSLPLGTPPALEGEAA